MLTAKSGSQGHIIPNDQRLPYKVYQNVKIYLGIYKDALTWPYIKPISSRKPVGFLKASKSDIDITTHMEKVIGVNNLEYI